MEKIEVKALKAHYYCGNQKKGQTYACTSSDLGLLVKAGWAEPVKADPPLPVDLQTKEDEVPLVVPLPEEKPKSAVKAKGKAK